MKKFFSFIIFLFLLKTFFGQDFNDRIFPKEADSIVCTITSVETNWIYYDHQGKKKIRNDYIHMSDLRSYVYNGIKRKAYEYESYEPKPVVVSEQKSTEILPVYIGPKDTIATFYLDTVGSKRACSILLNKNKRLKQIDQFKKIEIIDHNGNLQFLFPNKIDGYWLNGDFYRSFKIIDNGKKVNFFAKELVKGNASLYTYNGEQLDNESIYIFKKLSETEFNMLKENLSQKVEHVITSSMETQENQVISYYTEEPFLNYFQSYFSDCQDVIIKFKAKWYNHTSVRTMFVDYNNCK